MQLSFLFDKTFICILSDGYFAWNKPSNGYRLMDEAVAS
jgi:hypothetical protein